MGEKIIVGPVNRGLRKDRTPFVIDNDSFPTLINAYQWRGRIKRKRGTTLLGRLQRFFNSLNTAYSSFTDLTLAAGAQNLITGYNLQPNASLVPTTISIRDTTSGEVYTDPSGNGNLTGTLGGSGTVNYSSGAISVPSSGNHAITANFIYNPNLPVMGLEDLSLTSTQFPGTLGFDTTYSYNIPTSFPYAIYDVSFYKNLQSGTYTGYVQKSSWTPTTWNGQDYQQFWTTNYQGALWATNGVNSQNPVANIGMQYNTITAIGGIVAGPPAFATFTTTTNHGLVIGDFVFINEVNGVTGINFQTGYVTAVPADNQITVEFPNATLGGAYTNGGIVQYLTNRSDKTKDCLRWYDGDPTNGSATSPSFVLGNGWVNFCPPLSRSNFSIADTPAAQYYLVGARMILPYKDRLLFFGPVIQTSAVGSQIYLQDTVIYSQNGTPYYTCSFTGDPSSAATVFNPILVPTSQSATANAYWEDQTGFGGFVSAGVAKPILTVGNNEDVLVVGFSNIQTKLVYTGNDVVPFNFYLTNSELGSGSTFSTIVMDQGVITRGNRGIVITDQRGTQRIDLDILDQNFEVSLVNNGSERFTAQRDFVNEWIYFTYPNNEVSYVYPNQTLLYNYRDQSWSIFNECYTTYGQFRPFSGLTWNQAPVWNTWDDPWNSGTNTLLQSQVIAGNQQGFVLFREDEQTSESSSLYIQNISGQTITSPNHCLNNGDYIEINGCIGSVGSVVNGKIFQVSSATTNTFLVSSPPTITGNYSGGGTITRMYIPFIQTKQFPVSWGMARKTRLGPQQYLFTTTDNAQITLLIFLSQNAASAYNMSNIVPAIGSSNNSLIYSTILFTCPESANLGLTPANINLQMVTGAQQEQIWHRMNTSLLGDTVQIGFTLSDAQMRALDTNGNFVSQFAEIELHSFILDVNPSQLLA